jgi:hypothetical protein
MIVRSLVWRRVSEKTWAKISTTPAEGEKLLKARQKGCNI